MGFEWVKPNLCKSNRPIVTHAKPMRDYDGRITMGSLSGYSAWLWTIKINQLKVTLLFEKFLSPVLYTEHVLSDIRGLAPFVCTENNSLRQ